MRGFFHEKNISFLDQIHYFKLALSTSHADKINLINLINLLKTQPSNLRKSQVTNLPGK